MENRRKFERFELDLPAELTISHRGAPLPEEKALQLRTENICAGGAYLPCKRPLPKGTKVRLTTYLPLRWLTGASDSRSRLTLTAVVLRTDERGIALRFNRNYRITAMTQEQENDLAATQYYESDSRSLHQ